MRLVTEGKSEYTLFRPIVMYFAARYSDYTYGRFASDFRVLVESNMKIIEDFDIDMAGLISDPYRETSAFGADIEFVPDGVPRCKSILIKNVDDVRRLKNPDVYRSSRTLDRIKGAEYFQSLINGGIPLIGWIEGPLAEAADLAGVSDMLTHLMVNPDLSNMLMDKCVITAKDFANAQIEAGCDVIGIGDAICSQIDPESYRTYVKDRHKDIIEFIHEKGGLVKLHICGDITHLLSDIKDLNADIVDLDWEVDTDEAYNILGKDVIRCGNINPVEIQNASPEDVFEWSVKLMQKETGRKFILSAGCEITVNTPHENLMAMRKASKP